MPNPARFLIARIHGGVAATLALAVLAGAAFLVGVGSAADSSTSAAASQYGGKVTICHHTHSKKHPTVTITVSRSALQAHLKHGDTTGHCTTTTVPTHSTHSSKSTTSLGQTASGAASQTGSTATGAHGEGNGQSQGKAKAHGKGR